MENRNLSVLSIFVLNWNQPNITIRCVNSILIKKGDIDFVIFVIDNGSTDDSVNLFHKELPQIKVIQNSKNLGFQGGMNVGIKRAVEFKYKYVLLLNNDTVADTDMLENLFKFFPEEARLVSPGIDYLSNPDICRYLGGIINPILLDILKILENGIKLQSQEVGIGSRGVFWGFHSPKTDDAVNHPPRRGRSWSVGLRNNPTQFVSCLLKTEMVSQISSML